MDKILQTVFSNKEIYMSMFIAMFTIVYSYLVIFFLKRLRERRNKFKDKFFKTLIQGLKTASISSMDDIVNIYRGGPRKLDSQLRCKIAV